MTPQEMLHTVARLFEAGAVQIYIPLCLWVVMIAAFFWVIRKAHQSGKFDAAQFLQDDAGKMSWGRMGAGVCLLTMTWWVMVRQINGTLTWGDQVLYAVTWSGSLLLLEWLKTRAPAPPPPQPPPPP